jgi:hypothetical protein
MKLRYQQVVKLIAEILKVDRTCISRSVERLEGRLQKDKLLDARFRGHDGGEPPTSFANF